MHLRGDTRVLAVAVALAVAYTAAFGHIEAHSRVIESWLLPGTLVPVHAKESALWTDPNTAHRSTRT